MAFPNPHYSSTQPWLPDRRSLRLLGVELPGVDVRFAVIAVAETLRLKR